jgi:transcriptional regulator with XRE-family HTH domain
MVNAMDRANRIGAYLRARRERVTPADVGLQPGDRRRVPGLRREELALLAGISTDYLIRLEQGRDRHPSAQVLDALARALRLDPDATAHLHALAHEPPAAARHERDSDQIPPGLRQLLDAWPQTPAFVHSRLMDVLAANAPATALSPIYTPGANLVRATFLDPSVRALHRRAYDDVAESVVSGLRAQIGPDVDDPALAALVADIAQQSPAFAELWARHDVRPRPGTGTSILDHPEVGELVLHYEKLAVSGSHGQTLVVYHADPGSHSAQALAEMGAVSMAS